MTKVFIDGSAGTTGLRIRQRLAGRSELTLLTLPEELRKDPAARKEAMNGAFIKQFITSDSTIRVVVLVAMMVVYIYVLLGRVHFIIATSIYLIANFLYLKATKQWWMGIIIAVAMSVIVYYAFKLGFGISMP